MQSVTSILSYDGQPLPLIVDLQLEPLVVGLLLSSDLTVELLSGDVDEVGIVGGLERGEVGLHEALVLLCLSGSLCDEFVEILSLRVGRVFAVLLLQFDFPCQEPYLSIKALLLILPFRDLTLKECLAERIALHAVGLLLASELLLVGIVGFGRFF